MKLSLPKFDSAIWLVICFMAIGRITLDLVPLEIAGLRINQVVLYGLFLTYMVFRAGSIRLGDSLRGGNGWLIAVAFWAMLSSLWSDAPYGSLVKAGTFFLVGIGCVLFSKRLSPEEVIKGALAACMLAVGISTILAITSPDTFGTTLFHEGAWRGLYEQKNVLGRAAMLGLVFLFLLRLTNRLSLSIVWQLIIGALFVLALVKSRSISSIAGALIFAVLLRPAIFMLARSTHMRLASVVLVPMICIAFALTSESLLAYVLEATGKDEGLTGRMPLWMYVLSAIQERPFIGYGLDSFFTEAREGVLTMSVGWTPEHAHNGFLDALVELGAVGLALILAAVIAGYRKLPYVKGAFKNYAQIGVGVLLLVMVQNMTESNLYRSSNLVWILLSVGISQLSLLKRGSRQVIDCAGD